MTCSDFLARFSEFFDGDPDLPDRQAFRDHVENCPSCARYTHVVRQGSEFLRSIPSPELRHDFHPRLQHKIYHIDDEEQIRRSSMGSGTTAATVLAMAALLVVAAWYPTLQDSDPAVHMPVIVVHEPPRTELPIRTVPPAPSFGYEFEPPPFYERSLWGGSEGFGHGPSPIHDRDVPRLLPAGFH